MQKKVNDPDQKFRLRNSVINRQPGVSINRLPECQH